MAEMLAEQDKIENAKSLNGSALLLVHARDELTKEFQPEVYAASNMDGSIVLMILKDLFNL